MVGITKASGETNAMSPEWTRRLELPAAQAAAAEALELMQLAAAELARVRDAADPDALHDFRVAVRHLRAWLHSFNSVLAVRRKTRRRLQRLSRSTNRARDAEAALVWLEAAAQDIEPRPRRALAAVQAEIAEELGNANRALAARANEGWAQAAKRLRRELEASDSNGNADAAFGVVWAQTLRQALAEAAGRRRTAASTADGMDIHRYRISLKRVRYLLESAAETFPDARRVLRQVKYGQDRAGSINDLQHLLAWMRRHAREVSARQGESVLELGLAGQEAEARQVSARTRDRLRALAVAGRIAQHELDERTSAFVRTESRSRDPRYADGVRRVARLLRTAKSSATRAAP